MSPHKIVLGLAATIVAAQLGSWGWQAWQMTRPGFHEVNCWFSTEVTGETTCGYLVVRENRQVPDSRLIRLPVVIFPAKQGRGWHYDPPAEPILYLTGGPGASAYLDGQKHVDSWWFERRLFPKGHDLIVLGQRGTGLNEPDFDCEELDTPAIGLGAHPRGTPPPDRRSLAIEAAQACAQRLRDDGIDLTAYNSRETASDIAELRLALGVDEWDLYGISYGTRLALSVLRYHPEGVRAVILDSVFPPEASVVVDNAASFRAALHRFVTGCESHLACDPASEVNWGRYLRARDQLARAPVEVDLSRIDPDLHLVRTVDDQAFDRLLRLALYSRATRRLIQPAIQATSGHPEVVIGDLLSELVKGGLSLSEAVNLSYICHDEAAFDSTEDIVLAATTAGPFGHLISGDDAAYLCPVWPSGRANPVENTPVTGSVPTLLLVGDVDPVTPPRLAREAASHLANGYLFDFAQVGHGVLSEADCAASLVAEFLENPAHRPQGDCLPEKFVQGD